MKAAPENRRQVPQWQLTARIGSARARKRTTPQRQPPVHSMPFSLRRARQFSVVPRGKLGPNPNGAAPSSQEKSSAPTSF
jgi:hypothetical protein